MKGDTPGYTLQTCLDGSMTLVEPLHGQAMHSAIGPLREAEQVYIAQSELMQRWSARPAQTVVVFDVGLGIAANAIAAIKVAIETGGPLDLESFELYPEGLSCALGQLGRFPFLLRFQDSIRQLLRDGETELNEGRIRWRLHLGDFQQSWKKAPTPDVVFYDFYSPKSAPELWGARCLGELARHLSNSKSEAERRIITYSSKTSVRALLAYTGLHVWIGQGTDLKRSTTVASTKVPDGIELIGREWLEHFDRSTDALPPGLDDLKITEREFRDQVRAALLHPK